MNYIFTKSTNSYKEAIQATEQIEPPTLGFIKLSEYSSTVANNTAIVKQNNAQIQLLVQIAEALQDIRADLKTIIEYQKKETEAQGDERQTTSIQRSPENTKGRKGETVAKAMTSRTQTVQEQPPTTPLDED
ncbi:hypothetical protein ZIOFF_048089 [Zingiber officinale]|uniref:Uncharacterized protein n=1 Tax=Zingiber officinale TaxID=94328 RepID=A0A8J5KRU4_ZINOF|nr:hypothetical protein ZIOFF_048089 [Zingiber officinale]